MTVRARVRTGRGMPGSLCRTRRCMAASAGERARRLGPPPRAARTPRASASRETSCAARSRGSLRSDEHEFRAAHADSCRRATGSRFGPRRRGSPRARASLVGQRAAATYSPSDATAATISSAVAASSARRAKVGSSASHSIRVGSGADAAHRVRVERPHRVRDRARVRVDEQLVGERVVLRFAGVAAEIPARRPPPRRSPQGPLTNVGASFWRAHAVDDVTLVWHGGAILALVLAVPSARVSSRARSGLD